MRKVLVLSMVMVLAVMAGAVYAQDDNEDTIDAAWLGVALAEDGEQVIIIRLVAGSPADAAGLLIGDAVVAFEGEAITEAAQLGELVRAAAPDDVVEIDLLRDGESITAEVTLGTPPRDLRNRMRPEFEPVNFMERLMRADLEVTDAGYEVVDTLSIDNPFELQEGDVITAVFGVSVDEFSPMSMRDALRDEAAFTVTVTRDGEEITLEAEMMRGFRFGFPRDGFGGGPDGHRPGGRGPGGEDTAQPQVPDVAGQA